MYKFILAGSLLLISVGCASKQIKPIEEKLDIKAQVGTKEIGINESEEAIVQESTPVEDELRKITWQNYETERKLKSEREDLIRCRTELADPRLGGNKQMDAIPELEISEDLSKVQQKLGITPSGRIKVIRREYLVDKIEKEGRYRDSLDSLLGILNQHKNNCERELGYIRVQHGLPAQRYPAEGYFGPEGNFIVTRASEKNLDDAFKILATQTRKAKKMERYERRQEKDDGVVEEPAIVVEEQ